MDFVEACMKGESKPEDIDDWVEDWHKNQSKLPLHEWLGLTLTEYMEFVTTPAETANIVQRAIERKKMPRTRKKYSRKKKEQ